MLRFGLSWMTNRFASVVPSPRCLHPHLSEFSSQSKRETSLSTSRPACLCHPIVQQQTVKLVAISLLWGYCCARSGRQIGGLQQIRLNDGFILRIQLVVLINNSGQALHSSLKGSLGPNTRLSEKSFLYLLNTGLFLLPYTMWRGTLAS